MKNHFSQEQFARCFVGVPTIEERQHLAECPECRAAMDGFDNTVSSFRDAIHGRVDAQAKSRPAVAITIHASQGLRKIGWGLATAAVLLLGLVPLLTSRKPQPATVAIDRPAETTPDALMDAINIHLSRTVPAPMEPMMSLIPSDESRTE